MDLIALADIERIDLAARLYVDSMIHTYIDSIIYIGKIIHIYIHIDIISLV